MKHICTILLAFLLLLLSVRDMVTIASFKFHQKAIAATLCVNKAEPIPMCAGQCFLGQQLEENHRGEEDPFSASQFNLSEKPVYFQIASASSEDRVSRPLQITNFGYQAFCPSTIQDNTFRPPRRSA
ncbi:hypothetical protein [Flavilitoribacter nigricans]|uniref:Uncharacterized protein n=1 Tax=Flavilitoribacter nigricans (strain ATCC 23147 / DSM 23189 / NBRC 102662 / NCIMB 1420 / SS-2) TaxID=1122177 RepID=A0A2D0N2S3_FLAN2|nr:hypothetical protein [Flavilitoribacter nigricans]PHN02710.1 hypothetical protein CRP01_30470 [Flavilitoribacter nigricans DSM 23189 = NBRC 102662]